MVSHGPPSGVTPQRNTIWALCTPTARACRKTMPKPSSGIGRPPNRVTTGRSSALGRLYANGEGVPKDYAEAVKWYRKSAEQNNPSAQLYLGVMYANGEGVPEDDAQGGEVVSQGRCRRAPQAQFYLGRMYANGEGVPEGRCRGGGMVPPGRRAGSLLSAIQSGRYVRQRRGRAGRRCRKP